MRDAPPPYKQHGDRHAPGGSDPIPNLGTSVTHYLAGDIFHAGLASSTTRTAISLDPASASWGTEAGPSTASTYFDLQSPLSTYAITLLQNGLYVLDLYASIDLSSPPAADTCAEIGVSAAAGQLGGTYRAQWTKGLSGQWSAEPSMRIWLNWPAAYATPPIYYYPSIGQNSGVTSDGFTLNWMVVYISDQSTGF